MKLIRTLLIISSIGILCASSISDDGSLGHKRGGGSDDKGKQSGGDEKKSGGDSGRSNGGNDNRSRDDNRNKDDNNRNNNDNNRNKDDSGGHSRDRDRDKINDGGGSSGGQRNNNDRNRDDNRTNGGGNDNRSKDDSRNNNDRNNDRLGHGREDRNRDRDNNSGGGNNSGGNTRDSGGTRDRDRIGGGNSGGDINRRDRDNRTDDRIIGGGGSNSGSNSGRTGGGRMDDNFGRQGGGRTSGGDPFAKRKPGSTGSTVYGSTNNHRNDSNWSKPPERNRPPMDVFSPSLKGMVRREDSVIKHDRYRSGYYHYYNNWRDDDFFYGYYIFSPVYDRCVVSPFYWYSYVPGYISRSRVIVLHAGSVSMYWTDQPVFFWDSCSSYTYHRTYWYESAARRSELDYALDDLVNVWEDSNRRSLNRLIPDRGNVGIYIDERYDYSMNADDFYDMMMDNVQSARTKSYDILSVKTYRNEARVVAVHEYVDPWDRRDRVYHVYRLVNDGNGYTIVEFGTSDRRPKR